MSHVSDSLYSHRKNSASSSPPHLQKGATISSQVSSVGFNNLKKTTTNSSLTSSASTASTIRTNPLTRLFTKNRSVSSVVFQQPSTPSEYLNDNSDDDSSNSKSTLTQVASTQSSISGRSSRYSKSSASLTTNANVPNSLETTSLPSTAPSAKFRLPKKNRLKFKSSTSPVSLSSTSPILAISAAGKPQLTIQTGGHHGLKVSKKILSSGVKLDENNNTLGGRKNSMSSPVSTFHNLFHRSSHGATQHTSPHDREVPLSLKEEQQILTGNNARTSLTLSSNNSNSYISDINFALMYNFTNPDYSIDEGENSAGSGSASGHSGTHNSSSFLDIHKRLLVPTDQYLNKLSHKSHTSNEIGLGISSLERDATSEAGEKYDYLQISNEYLSNFRTEFAKNNSKFFGSLLNLTRPLFMPSSQKSLSSGQRHSYLGLSVEGIATFIKDNYMNGHANETGIADGQHNVSSQNFVSAGSIYTPSASKEQLSSLTISTTSNSNLQKLTKNKLKPSKFQRANSSSSLEASNFIDSNGEATVAEQFDDFKIREISSDLLTYFIKGMIILQKDFVNLEDCKTISSFSSSGSSRELLQISELNLIKMWTITSKVWEYFNQNIRFYLLCMFQPLQKFLREVAMQKYNTSSSDYKVTDLRIENTLMLAFRDILVVPSLIQRKKNYNDFCIGCKGDTVTSETSPKSRPTLVHSYSIQSHTTLHSEYNGAPDLQNNFIGKNRESTGYLDVLSQEEKYLKADPKLLDSLINCFGVISSYIHIESGNLDGEQQFRDELFNSAFQWLTSLR